MRVLQQWAHKGQQFHAITGQLNWTSTQTLPGIINYKVCEISTSVKNGTINKLKAANKYMHKLKNSEVILKFPNLRAYQRNETQDRKVGPGTLRWDPKKGT